MTMISKMHLWPVALLAGLVLTGAASAQQLCDGAISSSTPRHRFVVNDDGTVSDNRTGRMWMRCAVGSELDDNGTPTVITDDRCVATDTQSFSWEDALNYASDLNLAGGFAGQADWRVPNIKEVMSLVERQCLSPAINAAVFPDTSPETPFWSSTPDVLLSAYIIDFRDGTQGTGRRSTGSHLLRLVR